MPTRTQFTPQLFFELVDAGAGAAAMSLDVHSWDTDRVYIEPVKTIVERVVVVADSETPKDASGRVLPRFGHRMWPTIVRLEFERYRLPMFIDDAKALVAALNRAIEKAESTDALDTAACGHWAPCNCGGASCR